MKSLCVILAGILMYTGISFRPAIIRNVSGYTVTAETHDGNLWKFMADSITENETILLVMNGSMIINYYGKE